MKSLNEFAKECLQVAKIRERRYQLSTDTIQMLKHCAGEVVEATEAWMDAYKSANKFEDELADIITCVLIIAALHRIDIETALERVYEKNKKRAEG